jgi:hypothetical protein
MHCGRLQTGYFKLRTDSIILFATAVWPRISQVSHDFQLNAKLWTVFWKKWLGTLRHRLANSVHTFNDVHVTLLTRLQCASRSNTIIFFRNDPHKYVYNLAVTQLLAGPHIAEPLDLVPLSWSSPTAEVTGMNDRSTVTVHRILLLAWHHDGMACRARVISMSSSLAPGPDRRFYC